MGTAIQIAVAAALVLAWVWVLGRPLIKGSLERIGWARSPAVVRRRQLMLATLFAVFASFLLAIALRGRFVYLFALMLAVLTVHLAVASYLGARVERIRRRARLEAPGHRRAEAEGGNSWSSGLLAERAGALAATVADDGPPPFPPADVSGYQSPLAGDGAVTTFVEELIEAEWGSPAPDTVPAADGHPEGGGATRPQLDPAQEAEPPDPEPEAHSVDPPPDPASGDSEAIFTRPPNQAPVRPRRKARPIYIHSHLDEAGFEPPRAANQQ